MRQLKTYQISFIKYYTLLIMFGIVIPAAAQTEFTQPFGNTTDYKRLYFLNLQYTQSWVRSDTATYDKLLWAEDFVHQSGADGLLYPKDKIMPIFGQPRFETIDYFYPENVKIQFITNDAALVFARPPYKGKESSEESYSQYNDLYVKRNGNWICVSANITNVLGAGENLPPTEKIPDPIPLISFHEGTKADIDLLGKLNANHAKAFANSDSDSLKPILADDFILLSSNGLLYTKKEVLHQLQKSKQKTEKYEVKNVVIRFVAPEVALVHAIFIEPQGDKFTAIQYNDIYVKRNNNWVCVSGNNTPIR